MATDPKNSVLYIGLTKYLSLRMKEHRSKMFSDHVGRGLRKLIWFETLDGPQEALRREKQVHSWPKIKKIELARKANPKFGNLSFK